MDDSLSGALVNDGVSDWFHPSSEGCHPGCIPGLGEDDVFLFEGVVVDENCGVSLL